MTEQLQLFALREFDLPDDRLCLDCDVNTLDAREYYMVEDEVWLQANPDARGMLCVGCLEARLDRRLTPSDFSGALINRIDGWQSPRLRARILAREEAPAA